MTLQDRDLLAALRIPDAGGLVLRCRYHSLAVVAERRGLHWAVMIQDGDLLAALRIPDAGGVVKSPIFGTRVVGGSVVESTVFGTRVVGSSIVGSRVVGSSIVGSRVVRRCRHHSPAVVAERRAHNRRRVSLEQAMQPCELRAD